MINVKAAGLAAVAILVVSVSVAQAQPCADAEIAFDPGVGTSLDLVTLSASLANTGDEGGLTAVAVTIEFNGEVFGPLEATIFLPEGKEFGREVPFLIRPVFPAGSLTITVDVSVGECTDTSVATLEIQASDSGAQEIPDLSALASSVLQALTSQPTPVLPTTWGSLKLLFR